MDIFQFILGMVLLFIGGGLFFKNRDIRNILLGIFLLIMGLALVISGGGIKI